MKRITQWYSTMIAFLALALWSTAAFAQTVLTPPVSKSAAGQGVNGIVNTLATDAKNMITFIAGAYLLFSIYRAVVAFMHGSHNAQKREEAKTHLIHVGVAAVIIGGAQLLANALYTFGGGL
ncbi:MAG: hypothetical protein ACYCYO_00115 [Bacilli bacterium]